MKLYFDTNKRTMPQQVKKNKEDIEANLIDTQEDISDLTDALADETQNRTDADYELSQDIAGLQSQLDSLGNVFTLKGSIATIADLPATNNNIGDVYYVVSESVGYVWIDDNDTERWEQLGIAIDLTNYVTQNDLTTALADKQDTLTAGTNISIIGNTISATQPDTSKFEMLTGVAAPSTSTAGAVGQKYIDTTNNDVYICTAKVDNGDDTYSYTWLLTGGNGKQNKLTAGTNISIDANNVISASGGGSSDAVTLSDQTQIFTTYNKQLEIEGDFTIKYKNSSFPKIRLRPLNPSLHLNANQSSYTAIYTNKIQYRPVNTTYDILFPSKNGTLATTDDITPYGCSIEVTNASGVTFLACINGRWTEYNTTISLSNCSEIKINNAGGHFDDTTGFVNIEFDFDHPENHIFVKNNSATVTILAGAGGGN